MVFFLSWFSVFNGEIIKLSEHFTKLFLKRFGASDELSWSHVDRGYRVKAGDKSARGKSVEFAFTVHKAEVRLGRA